VQNEKVKIRRIAFLLLPFLSYSSFVFACNVPVYRYAFQYWQQEPYIIEFFHKGISEKTDLDGLNSLRENSLESLGSYNYILREVEIKDEEGVSIPYPVASGNPYIIIKYPGAEESAPAWSGNRGEIDLNSVLESPARKEAAKRLCQGETTVWIFLESGNEKKDTDARALLERELGALEKNLKLPDQSDTPQYVMDKNTEEYSKQGITFSIIGIKRTDQRERIFASLLLNTEPDLKDYSEEPMVFPLYGRGRVLYALVGEGITRENIRKTAEFLIGPCTCNIKGRDSGMDVLMTTDWGEVPSGLDDLESHPSVSVLGQMMQGGKQGEGDLLEEGRSPGETGESLPGNSIVRGVIVSLVFIIIGLFVVSIFLLKQRKV